MRTSPNRFIGALTLLALFAAPQAFSAETGNYITLGAGYGNATEGNIKAEGTPFESDEIGNSVAFTGAFGHRYSPNLRFELELAYHPDYAVDEKFVAFGTQVEVAAEISSMSAMANVIYDFPMESISPFIGIGAGVSKNEIFDIRNTALDGPAAGYSVIGKGDDTTGFAWQVMAGARAQVADNLSLSVAYHYTDAGKLRTGSNSAGGVTSPASEGELKLHGIRVGLSYEF